MRERLRRVHHRSILVSFLVLLALLPAAAVTAQQATPAISVADHPLDLAAMVLLPEDLGRPGFATGDSEFRDVEQQAAVTAAVREVPVAQILEPLQGTGFVRRYVLDLEHQWPAGEATPVNVGPSVASWNPVDMRVTIAITEYATAEGAAAGFVFLEEESGQANARDIPGERTVAEESELTRVTGRASDTGNPYQELNLTFRDGTLVGDVIIQDFTNQEPEVSWAEDLAAALRERMATVREEGAPGLGARMTRSAEGVVFWDGYDRLHGTTILSIRETSEELADRDASYGAATDVYHYEAQLGDDPYYTGFVYRFPTEGDAAAWLAERPWQGPSTAKYLDVSEVTGATVLGEASRTFSYGYDLGSGTVARGYVIYTQVGNEVARVQIDAVAGAPLAAVEAMARAHVDCLETRDVCEVVPIPDALKASAAEATPAA